jgi:hypothetical protein
MIYITAVHMSGGSGHEHIVAVMWLNPQDGVALHSTKEQIIDWLAQPNTVAKVAGANGPAIVGVVDASPPYLRTYADGEWTDNLLALPRY